MKQVPNYGPDNPHPLSTRKTELVWEGKYDEYGSRREVYIAGREKELTDINIAREGLIAWVIGIYKIYFTHY